MLQSGCSTKISTKATFAVNILFCWLLTSHHVCFITHFAFDIYLASRFSSSDSRRRRKVICRLSRKTQRAVGSFSEEKRSDMNTTTEANINFYLRVSERISRAFKAISILNDAISRFPLLFRVSPCPAICISSEAILVKMRILRKIYWRLWAHEPFFWNTNVFIPSVFDAFLYRNEYRNEIYKSFFYKIWHQKIFKNAKFK